MENAIPCELDPANEMGDILIYQSEDGKVRIETRMMDESIWLTQMQMSELFQTARTNTVQHIRNIYDEGELKPEETCRECRQTRQEGTRMVTRKTLFYNLDMIISLGYRVKSGIATRFRQWATQRLREYIIKGFAMDDERLKQAGGGQYWHELLDRIRDIRSSEKVFYRQVLDLYATSTDYDPSSPESIQFFKIVQNKLHFATHGQTAAEVIYSRADAEKPFMGLTTFPGPLPVLRDVKIAKNYLTEEELKALNNLVSGYFDFAELQAMRHVPMTMKGYIQQLDAILTAVNQPLLDGPGKISHKEAMRKAEAEYRQYQAKTLSPVEAAYLASLRSAEKKVIASVRPSASAH